MKEIRDYPPRKFSPANGIAKGDLSGAFSNNVFVRLPPDVRRVPAPDASRSLQVKEMLQMQSDFDAEKARLNARVNELTVALDRAKAHLNDKDKTINELSSSSKPLVKTAFEPRSGVASPKSFFGTNILTLSEQRYFV